MIGFSSHSYKKTTRKNAFEIGTQKTDYTSGLLDKID